MQGGGRVDRRPSGESRSRRDGNDHGERGDRAGTSAHARTSGAVATGRQRALLGEGGRQEPCSRLPPRRRRACRAETPPAPNRPRPAPPGPSRTPKPPTPPHPLPPPPVPPLTHPP